MLLGRKMSVSNFLSSRNEKWPFWKTHTPDLHTKNAVLEYSEVFYVFNLFDTYPMYSSYFICRIQIVRILKKGRIFLKYIFYVLLYGNYSTTIDLYQEGVDPTSLTSCVEDCVLQG